MACHIESSYQFVGNKENKAENLKYYGVNVPVSQDYTCYILELIVVLFLLFLQEYCSFL